MKLYFAARFSEGPRMRAMAELIMNAFPGRISVTSTWIFTDPSVEPQTALEAMNYALQDLADIDDCDMLVQFNSADGSQSPGRNIEFGYAHAKGKALAIVGPRTSVFSYLPGMLHFQTECAFMHWIETVKTLPYGVKRP